MSDASISIQGPRNSQAFEANSTPLKTTTLGINFSSDNDFSVPMQIPNGPEIYLRPDQVDAIKFRIAASRNSFDSETPISIHVNGQAHHLTTQEAQAALAGRGALMGGI